MRQFIDVTINQSYIYSEKSQINSYSIQYSIRLSQMGMCVCLSESQSTKKQRLSRINQSKVFNNCQICDTVMKQQSMLGCLHVFHKQCLEGYFKVLIQTRKIDICCPKQNCEYYITLSQVKALTSSKLGQMYQKIVLENMMTKLTQYFYCPTPGCTGIYEIETMNIQSFFCTICLQQYCLLCKKKAHQYEDCDDEQQRKDRQALYKAGMKSCPYCDYMVQKNGGCCSVVCCRCKKQFCFSCGGTTCPHGRCRYAINIEQDY